MRSAYYHSSFRKQHKKLEKGIQRRFVERLELFLLNPFNQVLHNHKLHDKWLGYWHQCHWRLSRRLQTGWRGCHFRGHRHAQRVVWMKPPRRIELRASSLRKTRSANWAKAAREAGGENRTLDLHLTKMAFYHWTTPAGFSPARILSRSFH